MEKLIGFLLPAAIDMINTHIQNSKARFWMSVLLCSLVATVSHYLVNGQKFLGADALSTDILAMFGIAQIVYKGGYEDSGIQKMIRKN